MTQQNMARACPPIHFVAHFVVHFVGKKWGEFDKVRDEVDDKVWKRRALGQVLARSARAFGLLALLWVFTATLPAAEVTVHYQPPRSFAQTWARVIGVSIVAASAALILYTLIFRRQRLGDANSKWMLFIGICVLPAPVMFLSTAVGLEQSKNVEFCASCHVMQPFVDDLKNPASKNLAAIHYKNRYIQREHCYRCHTDYGILGTMEAKKEGLGHIWKEGTGSYKLPIKMSKPYNFAICLDCHSESAKFNKEAAHNDAIKDVVSGKGNCLDCHDAPHPAPETRSIETRANK
jgi:nitrate/TMAO reductase-like tetraheme cytochrome c subunit